MTEWIWLDGRIVPMSEARIGVEDRGFQFADGVYEVIRLYAGRPFALEAHLERLEKSAAGIQLDVPMSRGDLATEIGRLVAKADVGDGMIYLQLTRGAAPRNHAFPAASKPTLLFYARPLAPVAEPGTGAGVRLITVADERWQRCWVKSIALLPNVLAKNRALAAGADEAVFVDNGCVTECAASNFFAVFGRKLVTAPVGKKVLPGITRAVLLELAGGVGVEVEERLMREGEARRAEEVFITSTTREISWVSAWDDGEIGCGKCGRVTVELHAALRERVAAEVG